MLSSWGDPASAGDDVFLDLLGASVHGGRAKTVEVDVLQFGYLVRGEIAR